MDVATFPMTLMLAAGKIHYTETLQALSDPWVILGFSAQAVFASRFIVQWLASERRGRSVVPVAFWYLSLIGTMLLAVYAIYRRDPVFILGQTLNSFIYIRNLMLIYRPKAALPTMERAVPPVSAPNPLPVVAPDRADPGSRINNSQPQPASPKTDA
jgi:lipid-A-disaccharide synthase-like uncharacterized protein